MGVGGWGGWSRVGWGLGGCERRIKVFCENSKTKLGGGRVGGIRGGVGLGGQGRCERRSEVFVKIQKKLGGGSAGRGESGWGGRGQGGCEGRIEVFE